MACFSLYDEKLDWSISTMSPHSSVAVSDDSGRAYNFRRQTTRRWPHRGTSIGMLHRVSVRDAPLDRLRLRRDTQPLRARPRREGVQPLGPGNQAATGRRRTITSPCLGLLNSSTACFWMKQVFHDKGSTVDQRRRAADNGGLREFLSSPALGYCKFPFPERRPRWAVSPPTRRPCAKFFSRTRQCGVFHARHQPGHRDRDRIRKLSMNADANGQVRGT